MNIERGDNRERKYGKYAIHNLSLYMLITFAVGYALEIIPATQQLVYWLQLEPGLILKGQVWRLFTWVLCTGGQGNIFWIVISLYFYYSIGRTLEQVWGAYRYNVYIFSGLFYTVVGAFLMYGILSFIGYQDANIGGFFSTYYVCMSIFLAFAATFPEMEVLLMFILPIKVKVLGIVYVIMMVIPMIGGGLFVAIPIVASLFNFIIFFFTGRKRIGISRKQQQERVQFRAKMREAQSDPVRHKCAICGRTNVSNPELSFRFCSKCNGNYEYCEDHLFTHKHIE